MLFQIPGTNVRVLGSLHAVPADRPKLPDFALRAYEWSETLIFEGNPSKILPFLRGSGRIGLRDVVSKGAWTELERFWPNDKAGFPPLASVWPWAAMLFAAVFSMKAVEGVEPHFLRWAQRDNKLVEFLEEPLDFPARLGSIPEREVHAAIERFATDTDAPRRELVALYEAWAAQDLDALLRVLERSGVYRSLVMRQAVFLDRNKAWAPLIAEQFSTSRRTLIAVGAGHLCGSGNLFETLGVEPIRIVC
jgi:uncharacterized protein